MYNIEAISTSGRRNHKKEEDIPKISDNEDKISVNYKTYYIIFRPGANVITYKIDILLLLSNLSKLGPNKITLHANGIPEMKELDISQCYVYWDIYLATPVLKEEIQELFCPVREYCSIEIHEVASGNILETTCERRDA